jgi:tetratricopeptide (TPR) repeat protein
MLKRILIIICFCIYSSSFAQLPVNEEMATVMPQDQMEVQEPEEVPVSNANKPTFGYERVRDDGDTEGLIDQRTPYLIDINAPIEENLAYWDTELEDRDTDIGLYGTDVDASQASARTLFDEGRALSEQKNYSNAVEKLQQSILADPAYSPSWELLGRLYWKDGNIDKAIDTWSQIISIDDSLYRIHNLLGQAYTTKGELDKATKHYEKSNEIRPENFYIQFALAKVLLWTGRTDEAVDILSKLVRDYPDNVQLVEQYARALSSDRKYSKSLAYWQYLREVDPENVTYALYEAKAMLRAGAPEMAVEGAEFVLEHEPDNYAAINILGDAAEFGQEPEVALVKLKELFDKVDNDRALRGLYYRYVNVWLRLYEKDPSEYPLSVPIDYVQKIIDIDPRNVSDRLLLAELLVMNNQPTRAIEIFEDILKYDNPNNRRANSGLYEAYVAKHDFKRAEEYYRKIEAFDPRDPYLYYRQAILLAAQGKYYEAFDSLNELERIGAKGSVRVFLYHGVSPSEYTSMPSQRRLRDQLLSLREAGFRFISVDELPEYLASCEDPPLLKKEGFLRKIVKSAKSAFSGEYEDVQTINDFSPDLVAAVTFDDSLRTSFRWGTPVAEEMGIVFNMHVPVWNVNIGDPIVASWRELREYREQGYWSLGSHLYLSSMPAPIDKEGYKVYALPNRLWLEDKDRIETPWEYQDRIQNEFEISRKIMIERLNIDESVETNAIKYMAYPMGDIGQETISNVRDAAKTILAECDLTYDIGFIQSNYGYAIRGQNPLLYQRNEPDRFDNGKDVGNSTFSKHPVFLARATKAELAAQQGKLYLALEMLDELDRDGYPKEMLDELREYVRLRLAQNEDGEAEADGNDEVSDRRLFRLSDPYIGGDYYFLNDNEETEHTRLTGYAGLQLNPRFILQVDGGTGNFKQQYTTYEASEYTEIEATTSRVITYKISRIDGVRTREEIDEEVTTYEEVTIYTNIITKTNYEADETSAGVKGVYKFMSGANLTMGIGQRSYTSDSVGNTIDGESAIYGYLDLFWKPTLALDVNVGYSHDVMIAPRELFTYDGLQILSYWRIKDTLDMYVSGFYQMVSDDNNILNLSGRLAWTLSERQNFRVGVNGHFITADNENEYYWTPFWLQRYYLFGEFKKTYRNAYARFEVRLGVSDEKVRDEEMEIYNEKAYRAETEGWYPGENPDTGWESIIGVTAAYRKKIFNHLEFYGELNVDYVGDYSEQEVLIGLTWNFF